MGSVHINSATSDDAGSFHPLNPEDIRSYLHKAIDFISDYYNSVESLRVLPDVKPGHLQTELQAAPPTSSAPFDVTMKELRASVISGMTHWASPNFFAFFQSTNSAAAIAGDLIASAMNTVGFTWQANPVATEMEVLALDWLAQLLWLPESFMNRTAAGRGTGSGVILSTTSEAILVTLVAARDATHFGELAPMVSPPYRTLPCTPPTKRTPPSLKPAISPALTLPTLNPSPLVPTLTTLSTR
ncbi:unnamed protein product [Urochloa humidicola]